MKKLFFSFFVIIFIFKGLQSHAQEIEVGQDFIRLLSKDDNGYLGMLFTGELRYILNTDAAYHPGFMSNVPGDYSIGLGVNGPNGANAFRVYGNGTVTQNAVIIHSDSTLKTDIEPLGVHTEKLKQLKCYQYHLMHKKVLNFA